MSSEITNVCHEFVSIAENMFGENRIICKSNNYIAFRAVNYDPSSEFNSFIEECSCIHGDVVFNVSKTIIGIRADVINVRNGSLVGTVEQIISA